MNKKQPKRSFLAYRALSRPFLVTAYESAIDDLVEEILTEQWSPAALDVDGSSILSLLMFGWEPPQSERKKEHSPVRAPLPGEPLEVSDKALGERWQWPALVSIWKGVDPFSAWPKDSIGWRGWNEEAAFCPALAAIQVRAWNVLDVCLRHPKCPLPKQWDAIRVNDGQTLLEHVASYPEVVEKLIRYGLDPNQTNLQGQTVLFFAPTPELVRLLLDAGANPAHRDNEGNDAPTYWGRHHRDHKSLLQALGKNGRPEKPNGEMVVSALQSNSWATVEAAIHASGWDPITPVNSEVSPRRLLPAASHALLEAASGAQAIPCRPLLKLLSLPQFKNAWTDEERACAAAALWVVAALSRERGYAFTETTRALCWETQKELMADKNVIRLMANVLPDLLTSIQNSYRSEAAWVASMCSLPIDSGLSYEEQGWECAGLLVTQPPKRIDSMEKERCMSVAARDAFQAGVFEHASSHTLLGLLRMTSHEPTRNPDLDQAWQQAWSRLPHKFPLPLREPWFEKLISSDQTQSAPWKAWILSQDLKRGHEKPRSRL